MRASRSARVATALAAMAACTLAGTSAHAVATTTRPGSILIFPKVVCQDGRDTLIQVSNTGNMPNEFRCFYVNGETCQENDFELTLTKQQPTAWQACAGRRVNPTDGLKGLDPGMVPPLDPGYAGALVCAEVDPGGKPYIRNQLKGEATIVDGAGNPETAAMVGKYNAVAVPGATGATGNGDQTLKLDETEYQACPAASQINFRSEDSDGTVEEFGNGGLCDNGSPCNDDEDCTAGTCKPNYSLVQTRVTVVPCNLDLATLKKPQVALTFDGADENESVVSGGHSFQSCWDSFDLNDAEVLGKRLDTPFATVTMRGVDQTSTANPPAAIPVLGVIETFVSDSTGTVGSAITNLHMVGLCDPAKSTNNRGGKTCTRDADCCAFIDRGGNPAVCTTPTTGACTYKSDAAITLSLP